MCDHSLRNLKVIEGKKTLAIIPARSGSKGLPGKNIKPLLGKPLLVWTVEQAMRSRYLDRIFVSTDGPEIAEVGRKHGVDIGFLRPSELAVDDSPTSEAILHALDKFEEMGERYDYVALLEPTSPLRKVNDIDNAVSALVRTPAVDCLVSVGEVHMEHPMIVKKIESSGLVVPYTKKVQRIHQRQQADHAYFPYGVIYISTVSSYRRNRTFYTDKTIPYYIERWQNYEIDDEIDFAIIELLMERKGEAIHG